MLVDDVGGLADSLDGADRAVGLDLENELVVVGALGDAGVRDVHGATADRREQRIDMNDANGVLRTLVALGRHVATANADADGHLELGALGERRDDMLGIDELEFRGDFQVRAGDHAGALRGERGGSLLATGKGSEDETLDIQNNVGDILHDTRSGRELVLHALDLDGGCRSAVQGGQQDTTHAVTERLAIATLERFHDESRDIVANLLDGDVGLHELSH